MKVTKKIGLILCAVILALSFVLSSCDKPSLKGKEIIIGVFAEGYDVNTFNPRNEAEELTLEWRTYIQNEYGFTMREEFISWGDMPSRAATSIMIDSPAASAFMLQPDWAISMINQKLAAPLNNSKVVNFLDPVPVEEGQRPVEWNKSVYEAFTFNGVTYGCWAGINIHNSQVVFYNKRLFKEAGLDPDLPYDLQKDGTWTWEKFLEICKILTRDTDNDGKIDTYAFARGNSTEFFDAVIASNGAMYVGKDENGRFVNKTDTQEFIDSLNFVLTLVHEGVAKPQPDNTNWDWFKSDFAEGGTAFRVDESWVWGELNTSMKDDWGVVMFPKGPKVDDYRVFSRENVFIIPATFKQAEVDRVLWAMALWYTPQSDDWKSSMYSTFRDSRAVDETLVILRNTDLHINKDHVSIPGLERGDITWTMWFHEGDPSQMVEAVSQSWNSKINSVNKMLFGD